MPPYIKKRPPEKVKITIEGGKKRIFVVPEKLADGLIELLRGYEYDARKGISPEEAYKKLHDKYGKGGAVLQCLRLRARLTQAVLAGKIGVQQGDISCMENGRKPIGKKAAWRLAQVFNTDCRVFREQLGT